MHEQFLTPIDRERADAALRILALSEIFRSPSAPLSAAERLARQDERREKRQRYRRNLRNRKP